MDFSIFDQAQQAMDDEQARRDQIKEVTKALELILRKSAMEIQKVHQFDSNVSDVCTKARALLQSAEEKFQLLKPLIPEGQYYRYHDHWKFGVKDVVFQLAFITFLEKQELITQTEVETAIGFKVDLETFLLGLTLLPNELSRYCTNCVTKQDYATPRAIQSFVNDLYAGFRLLNLKNDMLRKRFDSIKYDVKRIEEVVYDISIRKLGGAGAGSDEAAMKS